MKKLTLTKETIRDLSKAELEAVGGGGNTVFPPICCDTTGTTHACCGGPTEIGNGDCFR